MHPSSSRTRQAPPPPWAPFAPAPYGTLHTGSASPVSSSRQDWALHLHGPDGQPGAGHAAGFGPYIFKPGSGILSTASICPAKPCLPWETLTSLSSGWGADPSTPSEPPKNWLEPRGWPPRSPAYLALPASAFPFSLACYVGGAEALRKVTGLLWPRRATAVPPLG